MTTNRIISILTALLVFLLAVGAFVLSYSVLRDLAADYGLNDWQAYIWPLMIDAALVVCSLAVLRANLHRERAVYPWLLVALYSLATIAFNVIHAPDNLIARLVAVVAPISLLLSFELFVSMLRAEVKRHSAISSLQEIQKDIENLSEQKNGLVEQIGGTQAKLDKLQSELAQLRKEKRKFGYEVSVETIDKAKRIIAERPAISGAELGRQLGRSDSLGRRLKKSLNGSKQQ